MDTEQNTKEATTSTVTIEKSELNAILKRIEGLEKSEIPQMLLLKRNSTLVLVTITFVLLMEKLFQNLK